MTGPAKKYPRVSYERRDDQLHIQVQEMTNHELREVLVGLWARLSPADRQAHIQELHRYHLAGSGFLPPIPRFIRDAGVVQRPGLIDVSKLIEQEMRES